MIHALRGSIARSAVAARLDGVGLGEHVALGVDDPADEIRRDPVSAVGEDRIGGHHLHRRRRARAEAHRQVRRVELRVEAEAGDVVLRVLRPDRLQHANGDEVLGLGERGADAHRPVELAVVVLGLPVLAAGLRGGNEERGVVDDGRRRESLFQRRRVDERLERRSGLALRLRHVVELVALEAPAADERQDGAVLRPHRDERGFRLRQLRDLPAPLGVPREADHRARPDPARGGRLVGERAGGELDAVARDFRDLAVGEHRLHLGRRSVRHDRGNEAVAVARLGEQMLERRIALRRVLRETNVGLRAPVAVPVVVVDHASPHRNISRLLVGLADRRLHGQALRVGILAVGVEYDLPGHFGDELGVGGQRLPQALPDRQWCGLCFAELLGTDVLQIVHSP